MHSLRLNFIVLIFDISEIENYFREIAFLEQFLQLKFNFNIIKYYHFLETSEEDETFYLKNIEDKLLKM
jgi:hypothetical protein